MAPPSEFLFSFFLKVCSFSLFSSTARPGEARATACSPRATAYTILAILACESRTRLYEQASCGLAVDMVASVTRSSTPICRRGRRCISAVAADRVTEEIWRGTGRSWSATRLLTGAFSSAARVIHRRRPRLDRGAKRGAGSGNGRRQGADLEDER